MDESSGYYLGVVVPTVNPASDRYTFVPRAHFDTTFPLESAEFEAIRSANQEVARHRDRLMFLDVVQWNLEDYLSLEQHLLLEGFDRGRNPLRTAQLDMNRRIMNLLSSIRSYLDHTETDLKRRFGETSDRYQRFKTLTARLYDAQFSYRFIYRFRNFVQHCGLPLDKFNHRASPRSRSLHVAVSRSRLLSGFDWGSLRAEIENLPEEVVLTDHLIAVITFLTDLHQKLCAEELPAVSQAADLLLGTVARLDGREGVPSVIKIERDPGPPNATGAREVRLRHFSLHVDLALCFHVPRGSNDTENHGARGHLTSEALSTLRQPE